MYNDATRPDIIFILTHNDHTVADALHHLETVLAAGICNIGFKDIGLRFAQMAVLTNRIHVAGASARLEVMSLSLGSKVCSIKAGIWLGVGHILGGMNRDALLPLLEGIRIGYFPFAGQMRGGIRRCCRARSRIPPQMPRGLHAIPVCRGWICRPGAMPEMCPR